MSRMLVPKTWGEGGALHLVQELDLLQIGLLFAGHLYAIII